MLFETKIIGNVGRDPETKEVNGKKVTSYSVATKPSKNKTVWVKVTTWDKRAELDAQYVRKGMTVMVEGTLQFDENGNPRTYTKDGITKAAGFELTGYNVLYLSKVQPEDNQAATAVDLTLDSGEEIPF